MLAPFSLHRPERLADAAALLREHGDDAAVYAGGTELVVILKDRLTEFGHLVDIKRIPGLDGIAAEDGALRIGALATHRAIERSPLVRERLPELAALEANVANVRVRSAGTLGGNLCFAEPHSDPATLLVALGATLTLVSADGGRTVPAEGFFTGLMSTARRPDEILTDILAPLPGPTTGVAYERFKIHERPSASVAAVVRLDGGTVAEARVVVGSVGERPERVPAAEALLVGHTPSAGLAAEAAAAVRREVEPTVDAFESTDYKRQLAAVLAEAAIVRAAGTAANGAMRHAD